MAIATATQVLYEISRIHVTCKGRAVLYYMLGTHGPRISKYFETFRILALFLNAQVVCHWDTPFSGYKSGLDKTCALKSDRCASKIVLDHNGHVWVTPILAITIGHTETLDTK